MLFIVLFWKGENAQTGKQQRCYIFVFSYPDYETNIHTTKQTEQSWTFILHFSSNGEEMISMRHSAFVSLTLTGHSTF